MIKTFLIALTLSFNACMSQQSNALVGVDEMEFANTITPNELKEHLDIFASDGFEGRETENS